MNRPVTIWLQSDPAALDRLAAAVEDFGRDRGLARRVILDAQLVLEEVVSNIIKYGYEDQGQHRIKVQLAFADETLALSVVDDGKAFNPVTAAPPDLEAELADRSVGGLGIYLVVKMMDAVEYRREAGRNILTLRKSYGRGQ